LRLLVGLRHHEGNRIADMPHFALRERRVRRLLHRKSILAGDAPTAGKAADPRRLQIFAGKDRENARHRECRRSVNRLDGCMCMGRTNERANGHVGTLDISDVVAAAGEKTPVFLA